jgi:leucyl-tRNA synthetase
MRCPYCKERIKTGAVRCKHCHSGIAADGKQTVTDDGIRYLQNGFGKINAECDAIEERIDTRTGFIFNKHQYSEDDLFEAAMKVHSFIEKMRDDLEEWEALNRLSQPVKAAFNKKAVEVQERLEVIQMKIEQREPTWWEKVCNVFKQILAKLLPFLSFKLVAGHKQPKMLAA